MTTITKTPARIEPSQLVGVRLPKAAPAIAIVAGAALSIALKFILGWTGWLTAFFAAVLLFIVVLSVWSFAVEGRRRAKDRFASTLIYSSFAAALVPLLLILGYIVVKGWPALNIHFLTHSMSGVTADDPGGGGYAALLGTLEIVPVGAPGGAA